MIKLIKSNNDEYITKYGIITPGALLIQYNDEITGFIDYDVSERQVKIFYITIEDQYRRQGIARKVINQIIEENKGKYLYGDSLPKALEFWRSVGAEFDEDEDEDYLTPFHINC